MTRALALVLAATAVVLLVGGTGAFSSTSAERGIDVAVVDDENAYMGIESDEEVELSGSDEYSETYLTVQNRFEVPVSATVSVDSSSGDGVDIDLDPDGNQETLAAGDSSEFTAEFTCAEGHDGGSSATVTYEVAFDGDTVHAVSGPRSVEFDVECPSGEGTG